MIIINEFKSFIRDKVNLFFLILFPAIMIYLLGNMLAQMDQSDDAIGELRVEYIMESQDPLELQIVDQFVNGITESGKVVFTKTDNVASSKKKIKDKVLTAVVIFGLKEIKIYQGEEAIKNRTVNAMINGYISMVKAIKAIGSSKPMSLETIQMQEKSFVETKEFNQNRTMLDYYGISMIVLTICIGVIVGAGAFVSERQEKTINRLFLAPVNRKKIFLQKVVGFMPQTAIQIMIIMVMSVTLFQVHYATSIILNVLLFAFFFVGTFASIAIGVVAGLFIKTNPMVLFFPALWVMLFLGGSFSKEIYIPGLSNWMPSNILQNAAFDLTIFGRTEKVWHIMIIELVIIIVMLSIGAFRFERMEEER